MVHKTKTFLQTNNFEEIQKQYRKVQNFIRIQQNIRHKPFYILYWRTRESVYIWHSFRQSKSEQLFQKWQTVIAEGVHQWLRKWSTIPVLNQTYSKKLSGSRSTQWSLLKGEPIRNLWLANLRGTLSGRLYSLI